MNINKRILDLLKLFDCFFDLYSKTVIPKKISEKILQKA